MEIINKKLTEIKPYENNPRNNIKAIKPVKESILKFGFKVPIVIDKNDIIVCGHTRFYASQEIGLETVPCIVADDLTPEQINAFRLVDNRTAEFAEWDLDKLNLELNDLTDFDLSSFGFDDLISDIADNLDDSLNDDLYDKYTQKVLTPVYEITGDCPSLQTLVNDEKTKELTKLITESNVSDDIKSFLIKAAQRFLTFSYKDIAEYYAHANKDVQELFEKLALVIIDFDKAIEENFVSLSNNLYNDYLEENEDESR